MARSSFKEPFVDSFLQKKSFAHKEQNEALQLWTRRSTILPINLGQSWKIHNGKSFITFTVTESMIGHKFGEFALTRRRGQPKKKKLKKK
jgi:small subunit ribosomal protein S19